MNETIAGLARRGGVGIETVRYYQRRGLLKTPDRNGGVRKYDAAAICRLHFIRAAKSAGFTLEDISELLALDATEDRPRAHEMATTRIAALDVKIAEMTAARDALRRLAHRCGSPTTGPCPIIEAFDHG